MGRQLKSQVLYAVEVPLTPLNLPLKQPSQKQSQKPFQSTKHSHTLTLYTQTHTQSKEGKAPESPQAELPIAGPSLSAFHVSLLQLLATLVGGVTIILSI